KINGAELVSLRQTGRRLPPPPSPHTPQIILAGGGRVPLAANSPLKLADDSLRVRPQPPLRPVKGSEFALPLSMIAVLWMTPPTPTMPHPWGEGEADNAERLLRRLAQERRAHDVLYFRDGDTLEGILTALDRETGCRMEVGKKEVQIPLGKIAAIGFATELLT